MEGISYFGQGKLAELPMGLFFRGGGVRGVGFCCSVVPVVVTRLKTERITIHVTKKQ